MPLSCVYVCVNARVKIIIWVCQFALCMLLKMFSLNTKLKCCEIVWINLKNDVTIVRICNLFNWLNAWLLGLMISISNVWKYFKWFSLDLLMFGVSDLII
jgi:hypothetical protein